MPITLIISFQPIMSSLPVIAALCLAGLASAAGLDSPRDGHDLAMYVSVSIDQSASFGRRETRRSCQIAETRHQSAKAGLQRHETRLCRPGYWFITTDTTAESKGQDATFTPYQLGPQILDSDGVSS